MPRRQQLQPIRFQDTGIARGFDLPLTIPYDLENVVIERDGKLTGLNTPTDFTGTDSFGDGKPYFLWNSDLLDANNTIAGPYDGYTSFEIYSGDQFARNLYISGAATTGTLKSTNYFTYALFGDYDKDTDPDVNISTEPAIVLNSVLIDYDDDKIETLGTVQSGEASEIGSSLYQTYLFIPYNDRGEAGPWHWDTVAREIVKLDDTTNQDYFLSYVDFFIECNDETDYVEIYSTLPYNFWGAHTIEDLAGATGYNWTSDAEVQKIDEPGSIFSWYFRKKAKAIEQTIGGTRYFAQWTDNEWVLHPVPYTEVFEQLATNNPAIPAELDSFVSSSAETNFGVNAVFRSSSGLNLLQERRNLLRTAPRRNARLYTHDGSDYTFDGTNDRLVLDGGGAGSHQIIVTGDLTQEISANDYVFIINHSTNGWTGLYEVTSISFGAGMTTITSDNYTSSPGGTSNPADTGGGMIYFDGGPGIDLYEGVASRAMMDHNGTMLYGNTFVPVGDTKQNLAFALTVSGGTSDAYGIVFEYVDENGDVVRGPFHAPITDLLGGTQLFLLQVAWNGESALQLWKYNGSGDNTAIANYSLLERITPSDEGMYFTSFLLPSDGANIHWTLHGSENITRALGTGITYDAVGVDTIQYNNRVYLSAPNRPLEPTLVNFNTPVNTTIRAITPSRLAEAEGIQGYDFYVFTDKRVTLYARDGLVVNKVQDMVTDAGVLLKEYTLTSNVKAPVVTLTELGVAFVSTDNRLYFMSGRQIQRLDENIPGVFSTTWRDIAYHVEKDELWVANDVNEIWVYSFEDGGWNKNYTLSGTWTIYHLFYHEEQNEMIMYVDTGGGATTFEFDEAGAALTTGVATQEILSNGLLFSLDRVKVDYEKSGYDGTIANMGKLLHYVDARSDLTEEDLLNVTEDNTATPTPKRHEYAIPRQRSVYPTLHGKRHQIKISEFTTLDSIMLTIVQEDELD